MHARAHSAATCSGSGRALQPAAAAGWAYTARRSRPRASRAACRSQPDDAQQLWPGGVYSCSMRVRDYELDMFSVVNNAVYASYLQHARHEGFSALGYDIDGAARKGTPLALSELSMRFKGPLRSRDVFEVQCWVDSVGGARVVFGQRIERIEPGRVEVLTAQAVVVWLDAQYRPARMPPDVRVLMTQLQEMRQQQQQ